MSRVGTVTRRAVIAAVGAWQVARGASADKPALLGGRPVRAEAFPSWPIVAKGDEAGWLDVLRSGAWYRRKGEQVAAFEKEWAETVGVRHAVATNGGTTALYAALNALEIGPKDEVIVPPYTFIATVNVVLQQHAMPVFVDTDRETFQIDAQKIEAAITTRTKAILPVHLGGSAADMDAIQAVARKHGIPVVEDACQAHLAEWRGKPLGSIGAMGCFSFQASKNLNCGEGGVLTTDDDELVGRVSAFHNNGAALHGDGPRGGRNSMGCNLRMTEFQAALLRMQNRRLGEQSRRRTENAEYLAAMLREIPGIAPAKMYDGCTRNAYHLFMSRYDAHEFAGLPRERFLEALKAEGVPVSAGYSPLNHEPFLDRAFDGRAYRAVYSPSEIRRWRERNQTPENDRLCEEAFWLGQTVLLGARSDMEQIAEAVRKVRKHASALRA